MQFKKIYIEITNTCNLKCSFCIQNQREPRAMSVAQFRHVIEEIKPYTKYVYLHILGEPLSHPHLQAILHICEEQDIFVNMTTNGTMLKQCEAVLCSSRIRQLNVSLHSFPQHMQASYLEDVFYVCERLAQKGVQINYRLWSLQDDTLSEETKDILFQLENRYAQIIPLAHIARLHRHDFSANIHLHFEAIFTWPSLQAPLVGTKGRCLGMKTMCGILSDGSVVPCCLDSTGACTLGNVFTTSMCEILASHRATQLAQGFANHKVIEEICQHCSFKERFTINSK